VRAVFPKGQLSIHLRNNLRAISQDELVEDLFPDRRYPAYSPWHLALLTVFPCREKLPQRQAVDAVRSRLGWKDALSLELTDPGSHSFERVSDPPGGSHRRRTLPRGSEGPVERTRLAEGAWASANNFHSCAGQGSRDAAKRMCRGSAAPCLYHPGSHRPRVGTKPGPTRVGNPRWCACQRVSVPRRNGETSAMRASGWPGWMGRLTALKHDCVPREEGGIQMADEDRLEAATQSSSLYGLYASAATKRSPHRVSEKAHVTETGDEDLPRLRTRVTAPIAPSQIARRSRRFTRHWIRRMCSRHSI
jgi:hypothetical protein